MEIRDRFINRLKKAMRDSEINARELSKRSGLSEGTVSRYLSGNMSPRVPAVGKLAEALHVDPVWLMGYDEEPDLTLETEDAKIILEKLTPSNQARLLAYYQGLLDSQEVKKNDT